jgi:predicted site-specific integrase-resolvase
MPACRATTSPQELLEAFRAAKGWRHEVTPDLGSRLSYGKKGPEPAPRTYPPLALRRLVLTHKDRLLRFGSELIFAPYEIQNIGLSSSTEASRPPRRNLCGR